MLFTKLRIFSSKLIPTGIHIPILRGILKGAKWIVISAAGERKNNQSGCMKKYRIGIIDGAGFVGFSLAMHLSSSFDVKILDVKEPIKKMDSLVFESCDIRKYEEVVKALADCDLVIHTAIIQIPQINEDKRLAYEVNFLGTANNTRSLEDAAKE